MTPAQSRTKKFTLYVAIPALIAVTIVLLLTLAREFSFPTPSFASVQGSANHTPAPALNEQQGRESVDTAGAQRNMVNGIAAQQTREAAPFKLTFDGKKIADTTDIIKYSWNFGDGDRAEGQYVSHIFDTPGIYSVTLLAQTTSGTVVEQQFDVNVNDNSAVLTLPEEK